MFIKCPECCGEIAEGSDQCLLCGHATLATAFVVFYHENYKAGEFSFESRRGILTVP